MLSLVQPSAQKYALWYERAQSLPHPAGLQTTVPSTILDSPFAIINVISDGVPLDVPSEYAGPQNIVPVHTQGLDHGQACDVGESVAVGVAVVVVVASSLASSEAT